ncbi:hypothetical protein V8E53_002097 [Lactarius tabidus]
MVQDSKVFKPCRGLLANSWNTDHLDLTNNTDTSPTEAAEAAEPTDFAAAAVISDAASQVIVDSFPHGSAGAPIPDACEASHIYQSTQEAFGADIWAPFCSQCDWEIACWAKMRGPSSSAVADLFAIPGVIDNLELSYRTPKQLNDIIDKELPGRPQFQCQDLVIAGETLQFYSRDILQCIRSLYGDPEFACDLVFTPEHHYTDHQRTCHVYSEMHTGDWWWSVQTSLKARKPGATIVPLIISSNKTQLTLFLVKSAYSVYLMIGNIPKDIRRKPTRCTQMLITYIPTSCLDIMSNKAAQRHALRNIFHSCMQTILAPIASRGETGIAMLGGDGIWRQCHPIFAVFVGNYPEQALVTCTYNSHCPKCLVHPEELGDHSRSPPHDYNAALDSYRLADGDVHLFNSACREAGLKPVFHPFWEKLPLIDIFLSITPDILHQMLQGVMKHLITWLTSPGAFRTAKIDMHCRSLPPNHHIMTFVRGISILSRVTGLEHKQMCKIILGLIIDLPLPSGGGMSQILRTARALLDFLYLAQLPSHTADTLLRLEESLTRFHNNKAVFLDLGVCKQFNYPKVHSLLHYGPSITLFGTTDNYNTEQTERLHIKFPKNGFCVSNHKDEYPQMTAWLERLEKVQQHALFVAWRQKAQQEGSQNTEQIGPPKPVPQAVQMSRNPSLKAVSFNNLAEKYGAFAFQDVLADFIAWINHPEASVTALRALAEDTLLPFRSVPVFHKIKFVSTCDSDIINTVHVQPDQRDTRRCPIPARFDTVLVCGHQQGGAPHRIQAQVQVVFQLPSKIIPQVFPSSDVTPPQHLAYVEWFSSIPTAPDNNTQLYKVSRLIQNGQRVASVIPVDHILSSIHLLPRFGQGTPSWNTFSVLELCQNFYINPFTNRDTFLLFL